MTITEFIDTGSGANDACLIYKLTNIKNNKVYIGQTKNSLRRRIMSHLTQSRINTKSKKHHLQFAIQKIEEYTSFAVLLGVCNLTLIKSLQKLKEPKKQATYGCYTKLIKNLSNDQ